MVCSAYEKKSKASERGDPFRLSVLPGLASTCSWDEHFLHAQLLEISMEMCYFLSLKTVIILILSVTWNSESGWETLGGQVSATHLQNGVKE